ncbi:TIGR02302 family protein [Mesorhizobium xinjiangense]|uniref:TIGR02302 family protein n=1 Tax=Mesorhizobium xinjiangense TaxID=2678685 RepID=UPI0012ED215A|nr:TIGR02302 family protein [Mesorhizobium xinjiangense]
MAGQETGSIARLSRTRFVTHLVMTLERIWPLVVPILVVMALFAAISWFGLFRLMPDAMRLVMLAVFALAALAALYPLRFFRLPARHEVDRRIEQANRLEHTPVSAQADRLADSSDGFASALWREHQKRMAARLKELSSDLPRTGLPERDPWALRALAALLVVTAFAFSSGPLGGRLDDAFRMHGGSDVVPPRIDAWVTPPAYTGKPPIYLSADANRQRSEFVVPEGSIVTLRLTGGSGAETLAFETPTGGTSVIEASDTLPITGSAGPGSGASKARQFQHRLIGDGALRLVNGSSEIDGWRFRVLYDQPPTIEFAGTPQRAVNGTLELAYTIEDDYGVASGRAEIALAEKLAPGARPLYEAPEMPLSMPRRGEREKETKTARNLTEHPWAGSPVRIGLAAVDDAGQEGRSETLDMRLPERPFSNPLARAIVEQRRILALDANRKQHVLDLMDAVTLRAEDTFDNMSHYLAIMSARSRLNMAESNDQLRGVVDYLWEIATGIEDGDLSAAERRLRAAQEALRQALEDGASDEEIERLMAELREAMQEFLREFAERAARDPNMAQQMPPDTQELRQNDLERMLDQIEDLAKSGARDQAQELLSQLQEMMNNLQTAQRQQGQGEMRRQMDKLGEIMRRQQEMMNETHRLDQMQRGQRQRGQNRGEQRGQQGGEQGEQQGDQGQGGMTPEEFAEALRQMQEGQNQLQGELGELMQGLEGMGIQPGDGFGEAGEAMGEAGEALGQAEGERAVGEQGRALEALRRGAQDMMQQMQQAMQGDQGPGQEGGRQQSSDRDPLGRPRATTGPDFGDTVEVPDEIDVQRARRILDAIRQRLGDALSPELEKDYLERLLDMQ